MHPVNENSVLLAILFLFVLFHSQISHPLHKLHKVGVAINTLPKSSFFANLQNLFLMNKGDVLGKIVSVLKVSYVHFVVVGFDTFGQ